MQSVLVNKLAMTMESFQRINGYFCFFTGVRLNTVLVAGHFIYRYFAVCRWGGVKEWREGLILHNQEYHPLYPCVYLHAASIHSRPKPVPATLLVGRVQRPRLLLLGLLDLLREHHQGVVGQLYTAGESSSDTHYTVEGLVSIPARCGNSRVLNHLPARGQRRYRLVQRSGVAVPAPISSRSEYRRPYPPALDPTQRGSGHTGSDTVRTRARA